MSAPDSLRVVLDVGGSSIKSGRVRGTHVSGFCTDPYDAQGSAEEIVAVYASVIRTHLDAADGSVEEVVLAHPGPFDYPNGICLVRGVAKLEALYERDLKAELSPLLPPGCGLRFLNDAEAAIRGEARYGAGRPYGRIVGLTLGTGLGSAFVVDGSVVRDGEGVPEGGEVYALPWRDGIADDAFSVRGLRSRLRDTPGGDLPFEEIGRRLAAGDAPLTAAFESLGEDLGAFLAPVTAAFRADAVLVLGGLANLRAHFAPALASHVRVPVLGGELGLHAPLLGAVP